MSHRLKFFLLLRYGDALAAIDRREGNILVYGSNGPIGSHNAGNTLKPAIIVGRKGSHGKGTWAPCGGFCIDTALFVDKSSCKGELRYAFYLLQSLGLDRTSKDSAVPGLDRFETHNITVPNHDIPTQKAIADFLDRETTRIDQLIEKKQRMVEVLGEREKNRTKRLLSEGLNPKGPSTNYRIGNCRILDGASPLFLAGRQLAISVDARKKGLVGDFSNGGR